MVTRTAAKKREEAKARYDAFLSACPSQALLARVSGKWVALTLCALGGGAPHPDVDQSGEPRALRHAELSRMLAGASQKMLTQTLRALERDGLVVREVTPTVPVTVTYRLTALGMSLHHLVRSLKGWAEAHMDDVMAHRAAHDDAASK